MDEQIRIFNPTDAVSPYYFWNCTAFPNRPGTRFIYPMTLGTDHSAVEFFSWPIHNGKDLSWLKNYETYASIFSVDCVFDFFGAYDVDADRGIIQAGDHHKIGGKKAWTWGTWEFGLVSQQSLTDDGAATGGTMFAAIDDLRQKLIKKVLIALPVCPPDTAEQLQKRADDVIILQTPAHFDAVGKWYREFPQLEDEEVVTLLREH